MQHFVPSTIINRPGVDMDIWTSLGFVTWIWDLDLGSGFGTWIWDLDLGLDLGLTFRSFNHFQLSQERAASAGQGPENDQVSKRNVSAVCTGEELHCIVLSKHTTVTSHHISCRINVATQLALALFAEISAGLITKTVKPNWVWAQRRTDSYH